MPPLFSIATERFRLTWSGPVAPPDPSAPPGYLRIRPIRPAASPKVEVMGQAAEMTTPLRLAEQTRYRVFLRSRTEAPVELRHKDPLATRGLVGDDDSTIWSGTVDFEGEVGRSRFVVAVGGKEEVAFEVEVFPTKATLAEVEAMRTEVDEALAGLAFEYLRSTTTPTQQVRRPTRRATWLTLLRQALPALEAALERISAHPHYELSRAPHLVRAERVQRPDATVRRAVLRGEGVGAVAAMSTSIHARSSIPTRRAVSALDTPEHRWLRAHLDSARNTLSVMQKDESRLVLSDRRRQTLADLSDTERRLARLLRLDPLKATDRNYPISAPTKRLLTAPGYAEAYRAILLLRLGVGLAEGSVPHATRDLHYLYEMWCYLTVVRSVSRILEVSIPEHDFFRAEHHGIRFMLRRGHRHRVAFEHRGRHIQVAYNPRFAARPGLLTQRPDILLAITDENTKRHYVLDAKYRRDDSAGYARRYGAPGPPEEALGDLHRYRDAIVEADGERVRRSVVQAVALYPYRELEPEAFAKSRLWKSIETVGVGAIPLVPGATVYLDRWLEAVLG